MISFFLKLYDFESSAIPGKHIVSGGQKIIKQFQ